jgi:tetratricopeptide (TPR) repeat protein
MRARLRRRIGTAGLAAAAALAACGSPDRGPGGGADAATEDHLEAARAFAEEGRYDSALRRYTLALDGGADAAEALEGRGVVQSARGEHEAAAADFDSVLALRPGRGSAMANLAVAQMELSRWDTALAVLDSLARMRPGDAKVYYDRAHAWRGKGRTARALEDLDRALDLDPEMAQAYMSRGSLYARRDDLDLAVADFERAVDLSGGEAARRNLGVARLASGEHREAARIFGQLLERAPLNPRYHLYRGRARRGLGREGEAAADFRRVLELTGNPALRQQAIRELRELDAGP